MMRNDKIINLNTFEVLDEKANFIIVDGLIADAIAILNKLGYKTLYCCSGHVNLPRKEWYNNRDINILAEVKNNPRYDITEIRENDFDSWIEEDSTGIYIMFAKEYEFVSLPEHFVQDEDIISCQIELFENNKRRNASDVQKEIEKYNKLLYEWAKKLPKIN